jgi:hypothetical protein
MATFKALRIYAAGKSIEARREELSIGLSEAHDDGVAKFASV